MTAAREFLDNSPQQFTDRHMATQAVPTFYLYGEPHQAVDDSFVHVEQLDDRSRPSEWTIRAHAHADLHQLFLIDHGGGTMVVENRRHDFTAPALLLLPATTVHGFAWERESRGWVATMGCRFFDALAHRHPTLADLFERARLMPVDNGVAIAVEAQMKLLRQELGWAVRGHEAAIESAMLRLLILCLRTVDIHEAATPGASPSPAAALVARYRERMEARFRLRERIADHAAALCVSESALRAACKAIADRSPSEILDDRALLEAQRMLLYTNLGVAEIAYALGFGDPAYFSRFFRRSTSTPPGRFRRLHASAGIA